jgi:REP-associated tyrosine transposase
MGESREVDENLRIRRHHLPHWQQGGSTYFVTFRSARGVLANEATYALRDLILEGHGQRYEIAFGVIVPDHVHLLLRPLEIGPGIWHDLSTILKWIKGAGARRINQSLGTQGSVWQQESFDRIVRDEEEFFQKWQYMYLNPFAAGLVEDPDDYHAFVRPPDPPNTDGVDP